jgi:aminomethyltransferase
LDLTRYFEDRRVAMCEVAPGLRTPLRFDDPEREHMATRRAAGLFDFSFMACMAVKGPGAIGLLEQVQTRRIADLVPGRIRYTLMLCPDGTVLNDATLWQIGVDEWLFFVGRREDAQALAHASHAGVAVDDRSSRTAVIALQGPCAHEILARVLSFPRDLPYFSFTNTTFRGSRCLVARLGYSGERGYEIIVEHLLAASLWEALTRAGERDGLEECGFTAVNTLRIEAGHILFTNELTQRVTPLEIGLERLVDRTPPPRVSAQRRLVGFLFDEPPSTQLAPALDHVHGNHAIVTSACRSPLLGRWIGLGFASDECRYAGTRVTVQTNVHATVARLPFYDPMKRLPRSIP